jgi:flagellin-like hook-associated protein FlgL
MATLQGIITGGAAGSRENGLAAINQSLALGSLGGSFRADATRVVIMITDEDCDDFLNTGNGDSTLNALGAALRTACAQNLINADANFFDVARVINSTTPMPIHQDNFPDQDYQDVANQVAAAGLTTGSLYLDGAGAWVNNITSALQATGGPWDSTFQWGPDADDNITITFDTITAFTTGVTGVSALSGDSARAAIDQIDSAIGMIADAKNQIGFLERQFGNILDGQTADYINTRSSYSSIVETDMVSQTTDLATQQVILNASQAIAVQANADPGAINALITSNNVGQDNALLQTGL